MNPDEKRDVEEACRRAARELVDEFPCLAGVLIAPVPDHLYAGEPMAVRAYRGPPTPARAKIGLAVLELAAEEMRAAMGAQEALLDYLSRSRLDEGPSHGPEAGQGPAGGPGRRAGGAEGAAGHGDA